MFRPHICGDTCRSSREGTLASNYDFPWGQRGHLFGHDLSTAGWEVYPPLVEMSHAGETRGGSSHPMTMIISDPNIGWLPCCFCWSYHCLFAWITFHHFLGASKGAIFDGATCRLPAWLVFISTFIATCTKYWVAWQHGLAKDGVFQPMDRLKGKSAGFQEACVIMCLLNNGVLKK